MRSRMLLNGEAHGSGLEGTVGGGEGRGGGGGAGSRSMLGVGVLIVALVGEEHGMVGGWSGLVEVGCRVHRRWCRWVMV